MRVEQTPEELQVELAEQRRFLAVSCAAFDAGDHALLVCLDDSHGSKSAQPGVAAQELGRTRQVGGGQR